MTDMHCHILPGMDDGSRSAAESLSMLEASAAQGVERLVATTHFFAGENSPEVFLSRREHAYERLKAVWRPGLPEIALGAEVCWFAGAGQCDGLERLRIAGTRLLLLEMPFTRWTERMLREVWEIQERPGMTVLLAHVERYLGGQPPAVWEALLDWGVLNQCNADFFLRWRTRRKALQMLREGRIHFLGSDSHNMDTRPPRLGKALEILGERDRGILDGASLSGKEIWI